MRRHGSSTESRISLIIPDLLPMQATIDELAAQALVARVTNSPFAGCVGRCQVPANSACFCAVGPRMDGKGPIPFRLAFSGTIAYFRPLGRTSTACRTGSAAPRGQA